MKNSKWYNGERSIWIGWRNIGSINHVKRVSKFHRTDSTSSRKGAPPMSEGVAGQPPAWMVLTSVRLDLLDVGIQVLSVVAAVVARLWVVIEEIVKFIVLCRQKFLSFCSILCVVLSTWFASQRIDCQWQIQYLVLVTHLICDLSAGYNTGMIALSRKCRLLYPHQTISHHHGLPLVSMSSAKFITNGFQVFPDFFTGCKLWQFNPLS